MVDFQSVVTAWCKLSKEIIVNSFKVCSLDGSEDLKIHCFKKEETCEAETEQLKMQFSVLDEWIWFGSFHVILFLSAIITQNYNT